MRTGWTYLQLLLIHLHLLLLVPHSLGVPVSVISLGVVELGVAKASLELPEGVTQLKDQQVVQWSSSKNNILPPGEAETSDNSARSNHFNIHNTKTYWNLLFKLEEDESSSEQDARLTNS